MATIGHTLIGLSLGSLSRTESRGQALRYMWPGLIVLAAHLVDIVEWIVILAAPAYFDQHFVTNSPLVTAGLVVLSWAAMAIITRVRRAWPYLIVAAAIFSHLLLDHHLARIVLIDLYDRSLEIDSPGLSQSVLAEVWLYGLALVCVALLQAARQRDCARLGRAAAGVLCVLAAFAAITRIPALWIPAYALAALHTVLLLRRTLKLRMLWNLLPLTPLVALLAVELWAGFLFNKAMLLMRDRDYEGAAGLFERTLSIPTRSPQLSARVHLGRCQRKSGDLAGAEATLLRAVRASEESHWAHLVLADVYCEDPDSRDIGLYRPDEAARLLRDALEGPSPAWVKRAARRRLDRMHRRGLIE